MTTAVVTVPELPWWKEPTKDQWMAWIAAWLGWMLNSFDFTIFLLVMVPIAAEFDVSLTAVAFIVSMTLWLRLIGGVASGWVCDRIGRKRPLMFSILWYSFCNFIAGFAPSFLFLAAFRSAFGIGMGAQWPAGAALAMEAWPARSRGLMSGLLQGAWGLGFLLASGLYGLLFDVIGWRGLLWIGILPALLCLFIHFRVKESAVWKDNQQRRLAEKTQASNPLQTLFKGRQAQNTLTACFWMFGQFVVYLSLFPLFASWLQKELLLPAASIAYPVALANLAAFFAMGFWGGVADRIGRRWAIITPAALGCFVAPLYLMTSDYDRIVWSFTLQGCFAGAIYGLSPAYLAERFATEIRSTASAFCYHIGLFLAGFVPPLLTYFAVERGVGFAMPMLYGTIIGAAIVVAALAISPETKGKDLTSDLEDIVARAR
jgi:MFS transporter, SHS family, lactate transporter